jgi:Outer membrane protein Omp28
MKKLLLIVFGIVFLYSCKDDSSTVVKENQEEVGRTFLASTDIEKRAAVLEDFTGTRCVYCPQGHDIATGLLSDYGDKMIVVGVNAGIYADAAPGWPNFTTKFGAALVAQSGVAGYPAATVNRVQFAASQRGGLAQSRGSWKNSAEDIMSQDAVVNVGTEASFDSETRELTVIVDIYYTSDVNRSNNINVALLQDGIVANQVGGGAQYVHNHVLRDFITGQWGEEIDASETMMDSKITRTFTYTVPEDYNGANIPPGGGVVVIEDCEIAAYVSDGRVKILNGARTNIVIK